MIAIIDYGSGNLNSVKNAFDYLGEECVITSDVSMIENADRVVFPGVGNFGYLMDKLREKGLDKCIIKVIEKGTPFLGICLGLQALFEESEESPGIKGLGVFKGKVVKFTKGKVPQIGWNEIIPEKNSIFQKGYVYFVNSYYVMPEDERIIATKTDYNGNFVSAVQFRNVLAVQFHPEKSGDFGIGLLKRWLEC